MTMSRWLRYFRLVRPNPAADVDEELQFHIEMRTQRNVALGMTPDAARREAIAKFGDVAPVRDVLVQHDTRKQQSVERREYFADIAHDLKFGWRSLLRAPTFAAAAILTLALGIGANAAIFSMLNAVVLRPLPYAKPEELVVLGQGSSGEFLALREKIRSYAPLGVYAQQTHPVDDGQQTTRIEGAAVSPALMRTLGVAPIRGRLFVDEEEQPSAGRVMLLSYGMWQAKFGGSDSIVGKLLTVEGLPLQVIGVMPEGFEFPDSHSEYWTPYTFNPTNLGNTWGAGGRTYVGRLRSGVSLAAADRELRETWPTLRHANPLWDPGETYRNQTQVVPLQQSVVGSTGTVLWLLFGSVVVVLLIGCVNVANLLLARATARERELSVRAALGGGRSRLVRQLLTESLLLSAIGSALGILVAVVAVRWLVSVLPAEVPRVSEIAVSPAVVGFTALASLITALLFGIVPALRATRYASPSFGGVRSTAGVRHQRTSGLLVGMEIALAVTLAIGATLLARTFMAVRDIDTGFRSERVIAALVTPPNSAYRDASKQDALYTTVLERLAATPGVEHAAAVDKLPFAQSVWGMGTRVEGQFEDGSKLLPLVGHYQMITSDYFATMGIALRRGRVFAPADGRDSLNWVAVVSESFAKQFWPKEDAIGKRIGHPWPSPWMTIVGVVADTKADSLRDTARTSIYVPWQQRTRVAFPEMWVVARTSAEPAALTASIRRIVAEVDRSVAVGNVRTMESVVSGSMARTRFTTALVSAFALAALLLGAIGIYGVMSYLVSQRSQEMGIRLALGARPSEVQRLVVVRAVTLAAVGIGVGLVGAYFAAKSLGSLLYGVSSADPVTFVLVPLVFLGVAVAASYAPARRATRVDPVRALRAD